MHVTQHENVKGYLDCFSNSESGVKIRGWSFHVKYNNCPVRVTYRVNDNVRYMICDADDKNNKRDDVFQFYKGAYDNLFCGWNFTLVEKDITNIQLEMFFEDKWNVIFLRNIVNLGVLATKKTSGYIPSFVVVDDFYENADDVRKFALSQQFLYHPNYHKGKRTENAFRFQGLKESFESILQCKITNWEKYPVNGCFQYCVGGDQLVYHCDVQEYAGLLFLTPNAPPQTGTTFYRSKNTGKRRIFDNAEHNVVFTPFFISNAYKTTLNIT
jgi:hypothetical protein